MLSLGYFSLHEQREVTRSCEAGAKALLSSFRFHAWPLAWPFDYRVGTGIQGKPEQGREQDQRLSLPFGARATLTSHSAVEELFFARAKKRGPKKARPAYAPSPLRGLGPLRRRDFSTRHPCLVEKRRASLCVALRVFPGGSVAAEGDTESPRQQPKPKPKPKPSSGDIEWGAAAGRRFAAPAADGMPETETAPSQAPSRIAGKAGQNFGSNSAAWPVLTITFCSASHTFRLPATTCWVSGPLSSMRARVAPR